ncbi:hypothetical protein [Sphingomonas sp. 28-63-12]|uniref:hypothetical protein n=1 Tax=Sphingomonas sp. 28-63-12 TaxID=1970434 RepID=UPI000BCE35CC|nr:MAG: hypothetical protein B7Y47_10875 [Sphingomonas sp. 28-63-12]
MRAFLILAIAMAAPAAAAEEQPPEAAVAAPPAGPACEAHAVITAANARPIGIRPLGQEPDARQLLAVVRTLDGCNTPMVVNARVGFRGGFPGR